MSGVGFVGNITLPRRRRKLAWYADTSIPIKKMPKAIRFLGLGWGWSLRILSRLPTPLSVGAGLGDRATRLWCRTCFQSCGLGLGGFWRLPFYFSRRF